MLKHILVVVVFLVLLCIVIVAMVYQGIMSPIKRMLEFCREVSGGKLSVRIQDKHKDELSRLSGSMDHMADTIEHLMDQQKSQEKKKRELELQMLQYQLNPHFLFNTLPIRMNILRFRRNWKIWKIIFPFLGSGMQEALNILSMWRRMSSSPAWFQS